MATAAAGALLAGATGWLIGGSVLWVVVTGGIGLANGLVSGARRIYPWRSASGWVAFVLDSTWALATTTVALVAHAVAGFQSVVGVDRGNYVGELSRRRGHHVYRQGFAIRSGFLTTTGNVINGAGAAGAVTRRIIAEHEDVHVWQARWFGPLFPLLYGGWMLLGAIAGGVMWVLRRRRRLTDSVDAWSYYRNPFEWWAYSREGRWPPPNVDPRSVWRRRLVSPRTPRPGR